MKLPRVYSLSEIAAMIDSVAIGDPHLPVTGINEIHVVEPGDIAFVDHPKYYDKTLQSAATVILINKEVACPEGKAIIVHADPFTAFNTITRHFRPFHPASAAIAPSARIGEGTVIQPNVYIGNECVIGRDCIIHAGAVIGDHCVVGDRVTIHANTAIGVDDLY